MGHISEEEEDYKLAQGAQGVYLWQKRTLAKLASS